MAEFLHIKHPDVKTLGGPVTRKAFNKIHAPKGWVEATADDVAAARAIVAERQEVAASLTSESLDGIRRRDELNQVALDRGIDPTAHDNMDSLRDAIRATL